MNVKRLLCALALLLIFVTGLVACGEAKDGDYKIDFMVNDEIYHSATGKAGEPIILPSDPEDSQGGTFKGWYYDKEGTQPFSNTDTVTGYIEVYAVFEAHSHYFFVAYVQKPTCTSDGYTSYRCSCGENYTDDVTETTGHTYSECVFDSDCTTHGFIEYTCDCGDRYRETLEPKGHSYTSEVVEPTYDSGGYTLHTCTVCEHSYKDNFTPIFNDHIHDFDIQEKLSTCTEDGERIYSCKICNFSYTEELQAVGHDYNEDVLPPTITSGGYTEYTCKVCGYNFKADFTQPTDHEHNWKSNVTEPTCTEMGYTTYTCAECAFTYKGNYVEEKGHTYEEKIVIPPDEENQGFSQFTCTECGDAYLGNFIDPHKHVWDKEIKTPTCTESGYTVYTCVICEYTYEDDFVSSKGHSYKSQVTEPTCTQEGYTTYTCTRCADTYVGNLTNKSDHTYELVNVVPSDCKNSGYKLFACEDCGHEREEIIFPNDEHKYEKNVHEPTCLDGGWTDYKCSVCGNEYQNDYQPAFGHFYNVTFVHPTCTEMGYTVFECTNCEYYYWDNYKDAFGHYASEWGYDENGHWKECSICHNYQEKHEDHYWLDCECGYSHPVGTLWFFDEGDHYLYHTYQKPERGLLDLVIPATYKGKPVHFPASSVDEGMRSLTVEKGVVLLCEGNSYPPNHTTEELYFYCDIFEDNGFACFLDGYTNLKKLVYPRGAEIIRDLRECNIEELYLPATVKTISSLITPGNFYSQVGTKIGKLYFEGELEDWLDFDETVAELLACTEELYFNEKLVKDLVITEGITSIGTNAFKGCKSIESLTFMAAQTSLVLEESAFENCVNLKEITLSSGVTRIGGFSFMGCTSLESVSFAQGLEKICYGAFRNCESLRSVVLPHGLKEIDAQIFFGCDSLKYLYVPDIQKVTSIVSSWETGSYSLVDGKSTAAILFETDDAYNSAEATLMHANTYIPYDGFECTGDTKRQLNAYFGASANDYFENGDFSYVRVGNEAYVAKYLGNNENVVVPNSVEYMGQELAVTRTGSYFLQGKEVKTLHIPKSVYMVSNTLGTDTLESITVDEENTIYCSVDGVLYTITMKTLISYPSRKSGICYTIPETVSAISPHAFACPLYLEYVYAPRADSIVSESFITGRNIVVGTDDIYNMSTKQLGIIVLNGITNDGSQLVYDENGFSYLLNGGSAQIVRYNGDARKLTVPAEITVNGDTYNVKGIFCGAFYENNTVESVIFESGMQVIGSWTLGWDLPQDYEFADSVLINEEFRIHDKTTRHVFYGCESLKEIILPDSVTHVYGLAKDCVNVEKLELGNGLLYIHHGIENNNALKEMTFKKSILRMGEYTILDCTAMEEITIGTLGMKTHNENATMTIETHAIWLDGTLKKLVLGDEVKSHNQAKITSAFGADVDVLYVGAGTSDEIWDGYEELHFYGDIYEYISKPITIWSKHLYLDGELLSGTVSLNKELIEGLGTRLSRNEDITHIVLTEDDTEVACQQFENCINLKELTVKGKRIKLNFFAFYYVNILTVEGSIAKIDRAFDNLEKVVVASVADLMNIEASGYRIMTDGADFYLIGQDTPCYEIVVPESVTTVKAYTFAGLNFTKYSIVLHDKITEIEAYAFVALSAWYDTEALSGLDTNGWYWADVNTPDELNAYEGEDLHLDILRECDRYWYKLSELAD